MDDIDYSELEKKYSVNESALLNTDHILVIDGLPKIDESKEKKVVAILKKVLFDKIAAYIRDDGVYFVKDPSTNMGTGYEQLFCKSI